MVKKVLMWGSVAFMIFFIAYRPAASAAVFTSIGGGISDFVVATLDNIGEFFRRLAE